MLRTSIGLTAFSFSLLALGCSAGNEGTTSGVGNTGNATAGSQPNLGGMGGTGSGTGGTGPSLGGIGQGTGGSENPSGEYCDGKIKGYVRDFSPYTHQDFEPFIGTNDPSGTPFPGRSLPLTPNMATDTLIVGPTLSASRKPTYGGGATTTTTYGAGTFASWYSDTPGLNLGMEYEFAFTEDPARPGVFFYENLSFFPVDGVLKGAAGAPDNNDPQKRANEGYAKNFGFTTEIHLTFEYSPGQIFYFKGDDDVFVFINNNLAINLGGIHIALEQSINLDTLGLTPGQVYPLDFFHAERHRQDSTFRIESSLKFVDCGTIVVK